MSLTCSTTTNERLDSTMKSRRLIVAVALVSTAFSGLAFAQNAPPPAPAGQPGAAPQGRAAGPAGPGQGGGGRRGGFTQFTRPIAPQDVLVRGKGVYEASCASCHASDLRGGPLGANLLRSGVTLNDQKGELVALAVAGHTPKINLVTADTLAIAEFIHSIQATMGGQGSPPGRNPTGITLNVLVGDAKAGESAFGAMCASCHSVTGNLKGVGAKYSDPRALQNAWVSGQGGTFGGGGGRGGPVGVGNPATVTMADGSKLEGTLVRKDDFLVVIRLADGTRKSIARQDGIPKVDVKDPAQAHKTMLLELAFNDSDNSKMHNITAYLATIK